MSESDLIDRKLEGLFENRLELSFHKNLLKEGDRIVRVKDSRKTPELNDRVIEQIKDVFDVEGYEIVVGDEGELVTRFFLDRGQGESNST